MARATSWVSTRHGGTREAARVTSPVGTEAAGQMVGPAPMTGRLKVYHTLEGSS